MAVRIYIDQGHNPQNPNAGAEANGFREQDITYAVGQALFEKLSSNPAFEARLSRPDKDSALGTSNLSSLQARVRDAEEWGASYFISIHTNASSDPSSEGSEAFVYRIPSEAETLAGDLLAWLKYLTGFPTRGIFVRPGLYVLRKTSMPAVLIELGFLTNPAEARRMAESPQLFADGLYRGILQYFGML